ncbi:hypothetical protein WJX81_006635 [Elliptochloris bilobata]|uniref:RAVE complex protein Rav1 C-terminal domain-containing protein n=1 Tax=Elliptochloris bilobata TaxID=381761 RepID=A0AAW1RG87_9CHLO
MLDCGRAAAAAAALRGLAQWLRRRQQKVDCADAAPRADQRVSFGALPEEPRGAAEPALEAPPDLPAEQLLDREALDENGDQGPREDGEAGAAALGLDSQAVCELGRMAGLVSVGGGDPARPALDLAPLDDPARRALLVLQLALVPPSATESPNPGFGGPAGGWAARAGMLVGWGMRGVAWALLSDAPGALLDALLPQVAGVGEGEGAPGGPRYDVKYSGEKVLNLGFGSDPSAAAAANPLTWDNMRKVGAGFWLREGVAERAEALAKAQFAVRRDAHDCALLYLALGRRALLQGLFRSTNQAKLADFLARDFSAGEAGEAGRQAAAKNAFVLISQHRAALAAAFFVLAGRPGDAVGVCARELGDPGLAALLARLLDGADGRPLLRHLLQTDLLPEAEESGDTWAVAALQWMLGRPAAALQALLTAPADPDPGRNPSPDPIQPASTDAARLVFAEAPMPDTPRTPASASDAGRSQSLGYVRCRSLQASGKAAAGGAVFEEGWEVLHIEDRVHAVAACTAGDWGGGLSARPLVAATAHRGLVEAELQPPPGPELSALSETGTSAASEGSLKGSVFSALLADMLGAAAAAAIATVALAAHPFRQLYLSGCASGEIYLWQFGSRMATAGYTPLLPSASAPTPAAASLFATPARAWSLAAPGALAALGHWGQPQAVRWSDCGERFAAVGEGGVAAVWRVDAPQFTHSDSGPLARADWCHQALGRRGVDVAYVGGSSSVLAVGGACGRGNVAIWDTLAPPAGGPVAALGTHTALVTALQVLPGGRLLASADEAGGVAVHDLRALGAADGGRALLWHARPGSGGITSLAAGLRPHSGLPFLVSGSREGAINVWAADRGTVVQTLDVTRVRGARGRVKGLFGEALKGGRAAAVITGLAVCPEGLVSACLDGTVRLHPLL